MEGFKIEFPIVDRLIRAGVITQDGSATFEIARNIWINLAQRDGVITNSVFPVTQREGNVITVRDWRGYDQSKNDSTDSYYIEFSLEDESGEIDTYRIYLYPEDDSTESQSDSQLSQIRTNHDALITGKFLIIKARP